MVVREKPKTRKNYYFLPVLSFALLAVSLLFYTIDSLAQNIKFENLTIKETAKGFVVKGTVVGTNLNPKGQIVESDDVEIVADIKKNSSSRYPVLPDGMTILTPQGAETNYWKSGRPLTKAEFEGRGIIKYTITSFPLRKASVWSIYGGLGVWRKRAPSTVRKSFEGVIPSEYTGKTLRIRATLKHTWGGPSANWPAFSFHHDIGYEGVLSGSKTRTYPINRTQKGATRTRATHSKSYEELLREYARCREIIHWSKVRINEWKHEKEEIDRSIMTPWTHTYQQISEDIETLKILYRGGANYELVQETMDPLRKSKRLGENIRREEEELKAEEYKCNKIKEQIDKIRGR
ncbi:hypothetical protein J7J45_05575 [Candidatus Aerophobetes bacterium]|nr:hypothetical protein [Candidatus Aerophobetes bacterium]